MFAQTGQLKHGNDPRHRKRRIVEHVFQAVRRQKKALSGQSVILSTCRKRSASARGTLFAQTPMAPQTHKIMFSHRLRTCSMEGQASNMLWMALDRCRQKGSSLNPDLQRSGRPDGAGPLTVHRFVFNDHRDSHRGPCIRYDCPADIPLACIGFPLVPASLPNIF